MVRREVCQCTDIVVRPHERYTNYLAIHPVLADDLSEMERRIVHLYSQGIKMDEVCSLCGFSYNTLKYHNRNIYRKLGVTSRIEAVQRAKELKL